MTEPELNIDLPFNWDPRWDQRKLWSYLTGGGKRALEVAHRRWGKDDVGLHYTARASQQRIGTYWHMLPQYNQARKSIWEAVNPRTGKVRIDEAFPQEMRESTRHNDMFIRFINGSTWQLVGSDNFDSLVGSPPIGLVFSEYALANPMAWAFLSPILEENDGWAAFISTSRGNNHLKQLLAFARSEPGWFAEVLTAEDTPVFSFEQLNRIRQEYRSTFGPDHGEALFQQEYLCSFEGAVHGSYFGRQMTEARKEGRITQVPHQRGHGVDTAWDLGVDDSMTIWFFQLVGKQIHVIDYYESSGYGLEHYAKVLQGKPYTYANHYMPHDAAARELSSGEIARSRKEVAESLGIKPITVVQRARNIEKIVHVQIPAARNMIPLCWFDEAKCSQGIAALEAYRTEYDEDKKKLGNKPVHDWSSHGASAFLTYAVGYGIPNKRHIPAGVTTDQMRAAWRARVG